MAAKKAKKAATKVSASANDVFALMDSLEGEQEFHAIELQEKAAEDFLSTGCLSLDVGLGGGYYGGQVIQFYGPEHSGKSTMGYSSAAYLTSIGIPVAYLDYEGTTDKKYTQQPGIGVDYKKVRYFRPPTTEAGYDWIYNFVSKLPDKHSGLPQAVIFIDTIAAMLPEVWVDNPKNKQPGRDAAAHSLGWKRIQTLITNKHVSIVAMNQIRANVGNPYQAPENLPGGNAWKFATGNLVRVGRGKTEQTPDGEMFQLMRFKTQKNKNFIPLQEVHVHLHLGLGIDPASDVCAFAQMAGYFWKRRRDKKTKEWVYSKTGKGLPSLRGLDEYVPGVDGDYASLSELHARIREEGKKGDIYRACRLALQKGDAIQRYRNSKKKLEDEDEDVSTLSAKREKVSTIDVDAGVEDDDFDAEETSEEPTEDSAPDPVDPVPDEDENPQPAALGSRKKAAKKVTKKKTTRKKATKKKAAKKKTSRRTKKA